MAWEITYAVLSVGYKIVSSQLHTVRSQLCKKIVHLLEESRPTFLKKEDDLIDDISICNFMNKLLI